MRFNCNANINGASAAVNQNGTVMDTSQVFAISAQSVVTGTSTGTLNIQGSNDIAPAVDSSGKFVPTNWSTIGTVAIAGANTYMIPKFDVCYSWIRASFTFGNAAVGTITVNIKTLGF